LATFDVLHLAATPRDRDSHNPEDRESAAEREKDVTTMTAKGQNAQGDT
jgi:hypothetical protein